MRSVNLYHDAKPRSVYGSEKFRDQNQEVLMVLSDLTAA